MFLFLEMIRFLILIPISYVSLLGILPSFAFSLEEINTLNTRQDPQNIDPEDFSWVKNWAAVGDSYAAGVGSGQRLSGAGNWWCSRYDHSYAALVNADLTAGGPKGRTFNYWPCSGATNDKVIGQLDALGDRSQDMVTISSGGNDVGFSDLLNECVYQWSPHTNYWTDACQNQITKSHDLIHDHGFAQALDRVIETARNKVRPSGSIFWVGYGFFFDDSDGQCNGISWGSWKAWPWYQYLSQDHRRKMNDLVTDINNAIQSAVSRAESVIFVDWNPYSVDTYGRFCERGYPETNEDRYGLLFYNWYTDDSKPPNFGPSTASTTLTRSNTPLLNGSFEWQIDSLIRQALAANSSLQPAVPWGDLGPQANAVPATIKIEPTNEEVGTTSSSITPDGYTKIFHPRPPAHQMIANLIMYKLAVRRAEQYHIDFAPESIDLDRCPAPVPPPLDSTSTSPKTIPPGGQPLSPSNVDPGVGVKPGTELRILPLGDSITLGFLSTDKNGYRLRLFNNLSGDNVTFAGTQKNGTMEDSWNEGHPGKTIQYIHDVDQNALNQNPNIVLLMAGTNDMNPNNPPATEGSNPDDASRRLGDIIDQINKQLPKTVVLVALLPGTNDTPQHAANTDSFNKLIPGLVAQRQGAGYPVATVDMTSVKGNLIRAGDVHPTDEGYRVIGDVWYGALHQIPSEWIQASIGPGPFRPNTDSRHGDLSANGGPASDIDDPDYGTSPFHNQGVSGIGFAAGQADKGGVQKCNALPIWVEIGHIAQGVGKNGDWKYHKNWVQASPDQPQALGLHRDASFVSLADMDGDGKADYLWVDPTSGQLTCYLNVGVPNWKPAGTNTDPRKLGVIADGAGEGASIFFADMNGDGKADYLVVNSDTGAVDVYWNLGADPHAENGWRFQPGGQIASGVPHANLATLSFPDINGDGRADYVIVGESGAIAVWLNVGQPGSFKVSFADQGGVATGVGGDISSITVQDINGDGRADYLIWDPEGGITGFLNQPTQREGVPFFVDQGPPKTIADGVGQDPASIRLADLDGDGKPDYCYIDTEGAIWLWWNHGTVDTSMAGDGVRFADMDGDGVEDYVWLDPHNGAPTVYTNKGFSNSDPLGWQWNPANPPVVANGGGPANTIILADMNGDGKADYVVVDAKTGALNLIANFGPDSTAANGWRFEPIGTIAQGLGPGVNTRLADIDGDGRADYLQLGPHGELTVYRNVYPRDPSKQADFVELPGAAAGGIGQIPGDISFYDINGDNKADYIFTSHYDGSAQVWLNDYPNQPAWLPQQQPLKPFLALASVPNKGLSGRNIRYGRLQSTNRAAYIDIEPNTGAVAAWLNQCNSQDPSSPCPAPLDDSGNGEFIYWESPGGSGGRLGTTFTYGITKRSDWNVDYVGKQGQPNQIGTSPSANGTAPNFSLDGGGECAQSGRMHFTKTCGPNSGYNVVGVRGGVAFCTVDTNGQPLGLENKQGTDWEPFLVCKGSICA